MSIANIFMSGDNAPKFMIPCAGKMFHSSISRNDKALCHCLNKGYIETSSFETLYNLVEDLRVLNSWAVLVGRMEKVMLRNRSVVYRQRLYIRSIVKLVDFCKRTGIMIDFTRDFEVCINNIMFCIGELQYLEKYARYFDCTIDRYLTDTCVVQMHLLLRDKHITSPINAKAERILENKLGYLNRSPLLVGTYNIEKHTSSVYIPKITSDRRMVTVEHWGYIESLVAKDRKEGVV